MQERSEQAAKNKRKRLIHALIVAAMIIFIIIPAAVLMGLWISVREERATRHRQVTVPNVVGQDYRKGESILEEKGLKMRVLARRWDQNQSDGIIIDQSPPAGDNVEAGHSVGVTIGGEDGRQSR